MVVVVLAEMCKFDGDRNGAVENFNVANEIDWRAMEEDIRSNRNSQHLHLCIYNYRYFISMFMLRVVCCMLHVVLFLMVYFRYIFVQLAGVMNDII